MKLVTLLIYLCGVISPQLHATYDQSGYEYPVLEGSDQDIEQQVNEALMGSQALRGTNIQASVDNDEVTLTGTVHSSSQKSIAGSIVNSVQGVSFVHNRLIVEE